MAGELLDTPGLLLALRALACARVDFKNGDSTLWSLHVAGFSKISARHAERRDASFVSDLRAPAGANLSYNASKTIPV